MIATAPTREPHIVIETPAGDVDGTRPAWHVGLRVGDRVVVTTGGRRGETGTVHDIYPRNDIVKVVTLLDTWTLYHGPVKAVAA